MCPKSEVLKVLKVLVSERLSATAEQICALLERTLEEYEEELRRCKEENQRNQRLLDAALRGPSGAAAAVQTQNQSRATEETPESRQIKEEAEEPSVKQEEEPLPEFTAVCVKSEEPSSLLRPRQTEAREEEEQPARAHGHFPSRADPQTDCSSDTDDDEDWEAPAAASTARTETEEHGERNERTPRTDASPAAHNSGLFGKSKCGAEPGTAGAGGGVERKYECFVCKKRFASKLHLTIHIRVHTGEKPYSCSVCMKTFAQKGNLTAHMKTHTGEKPYSCSICEKSFARMSMLNRHIQVHTGDKPYSCSVCKKAFSQKFDMDVHVRSHSSEHFYTGLGGGGASWFGGVASVQTEPMECVEMPPPTL
ncbi:hypothetical protein NL108_012394 [Boleophthalmus pectinirostris]|uniref:zinc finger protein 771-like n=1 Tax=Boleophthalmus pectinirostris TaxID=150288 RepID=UPI0024311047|nr:zinc finger protein 771-like [Boleophthalmus pectinirostris]KAJ0065474.1 hypothetical protein NL108_012394 [Boleophthalmus pectinirostris]